MEYGLLCYADALNSEQLIDQARRAEAAGFTTLWLPELTGRDPFVSCATVLGATTTIRAGTAIANVYARDAVATKAAAWSLADGYGDRFELGLGLSNRPGNLARGHDWLPPLTKIRDFMDRFDAAELGFHAGHRVPTYLAAHGPRLLEFAAERLDGAFSYLQTVAYSAEAHGLLAGKKLHLLQPTVFSSQPDRARQVARKVISVYLGLANYHRAWRERGFEDHEFSDGGSDAFIDALVAWGDQDRIAGRFAEHRAQGVDHIIVVPVLLDLNAAAGWDTLARLIA